MVKRLIILFMAILVVVIIAVALRLAANVTWPNWAPNQFDQILATPNQVQETPATPTIPGLMATGLPITSPTQRPVSQGPVCFEIVELPPIAFSPDGESLLVRTSSGVQVFDIASGKLQAYIKSSQSLMSAALSPDGKRLAWGFQDGTIQLVDLSTQQILANLSGHPDAAYDLEFSPDGDRLYSASHDGLVRVWDMQGEQLPAIQVGYEVLGFGLSADGSKLATIPFDGPVSLWELAGNTKVMELASTGGYDTSEAYFSPDGEYLAADLATGIYMWRLADGSLVWNKVHNSMAVAFSPDGQYLAYSDIDDSNMVALAVPDTGQFIRLVDRMQSPVWELTFSPDASKLAITDGVEIHIRQVTDGTLLAVGKSACP